VTAAGLVLTIGVMAAIVAYSPTLYRLFCQATGFGGTTQRVAANTSAKSGKMVTVFFDANVAPNLPWRFSPVQRSARLRLGETAVAFFEAENLSDHNVVGRATFNVTPEKAGVYFKKIQCFCFAEERLGARQKVEMPVQFFVDPKIAADPGTRDVDQITLSYTFFRTENSKRALDLARFSGAAPDPEAGKELFASQCSGCHSLDKTRDGPPLAGVIGRKAGSIRDYRYSQALAQSGIVWSEGRPAPVRSRCLDADVGTGCSDTMRNHRLSAAGRPPRECQPSRSEAGFGEAARVKAVAFRDAYILQPNWFARSRGRVI